MTKVHMDKNKEKELEMVLGKLLAERLAYEATLNEILTSTPKHGQTHFDMLCERLKESDREYHKKK